MVTYVAVANDLPQPATRLADIRAVLYDEYSQGHRCPWIVAYSGGKDSTLVAHLVFEMLMALPPSQRIRPVHIIANDTLVESPLVVEHMTDSIKEIGDASTVFDLPVKTCITQPEANQSFWVNLIGRGYPSPNQSFRWCTDRMKIQPTSRYVKEQVSAAGQVILLLGVRRSESAARSASVARHDNNERLHPHGDLSGCMVFRPIVELSTDDVWEFLSCNAPPWGGSHQKLIKLYRDAGGGECPVVTQKSDVPSCGTRSPRFGCWTCTVVDKDRSLAGFVESGFNEFEPLLDFRDWLVSIRNDPHRRQARRRNGKITMTSDGKLIPGPYTIQTRAEILDNLKAAQAETGKHLISEEEVEMIRKIWTDDIIRQSDAQAVSIHQVKNSK
ncbi:DNA phosphorothioation system sulfurtransferase DndC [Candidatus Spongiihabitans sp.]|uniref:DNA phosphorothioation system sulfurtransferase DndC n=1 Tax=Candidatus Spongiihabitans sp. TaxID=3101308 RepID=UPI003C7A4BCB